MITDVYIVYNDDCHLDRVNEEEVKPFLHLIDQRTKNGNKDARKLMTHWGASQIPFVICFEGEKPIKAFYTEFQTNVIEDLLDYLKYGET